MKLGMFCLPALGSLGRAFFCLFCIVGSQGCHSMNFNMLIQR
ncbi:hypothetical protein ECE128010_0121 [Escherichia coli E128010]|nr:hypothetical protein ECE128010_0121 [Escherichia coli E128010]